MTKKNIIIGLCIFSIFVTIILISFTEKIEKPNTETTTVDGVETEGIDGSIFIEQNREATYADLKTIPEYREFLENTITVCETEENQTREDILSGLATELVDAQREQKLLGDDAEGYEYLLANYKNDAAKACEKIFTVDEIINI